MASANDIIEAPTRIEPARLEETPEAIADAIAALSSASAALGARLHPATAANLSDLVRLMNCCYSNLIEGHNTPPRDIARALVGDLDEDEGRRNLQIESGRPCPCPGEDRSSGRRGSAARAGVARLHPLAARRVLPRRAGGDAEHQVRPR